MVALRLQGLEKIPNPERSLRADSLARNRSVDLAHSSPDLECYLSTEASFGSGTWFEGRLDRLGNKAGRVREESAGREPGGNPGRSSNAPRKLFSMPRP